MTLFFGLTGSIGMGKSTTAQMFRDLEVPVYDSDATVHALYSGRAAAPIEAGFPGTTKNGVVDRTELSKYVVGNETAMKKLEAIVHPLVREEELKFRQTVIDSGEPLAILDIPLLFETGGEKRVDGIVVVTAPAEVQRERVLAREGMTAEKFEAILQRQVPDAEKRSKADYVVDTSKGMDWARQEVAKIVDEVVNRQT
ncbi:MAG: dephospho-CoA kinase [Hyphomicrobiales bacterium]|nr:dephospho-CoA kinase [Hyphomicrobiales bacterium]